MYISVILLTYNRPNPLKNCLGSLSQQILDKNRFEVIVVDDGSVVDNLSVVEEFRKSLVISYLKQPHKGISAARNLGIKNAKGYFIAFIADDYYLPRDYLSKALSLFKKCPEATIFSFNILSCGRGFSKYIQRLYYQLTLGQHIRRNFKDNGVIKSYSLSASRAAVFRKEVFHRIGLFDEELKRGEDTDFAKRLAQQNIPVYFFYDYYIEHWEDKNFVSFLKQRWQYAQSHIEFLKKWHPESNLLKLSFFGFLKETSQKYIQFLVISKKINKLKNYILFSPFIISFLISRYLSIYFAAKKKRV